jgi:hypothetical protein
MKILFLQISSPILPGIILNMRRDVSTTLGKGSALSSLAAFRDGISRFVALSRLEWSVGRVGLGVPLVGCGAGIGFWSPIQVPFVGPLLSNVSHNLALADRSLLGGFGRRTSGRVAGLTRRLLPVGAGTGTGCGIGVGYGYGVGLFFKPGPLDWLSVVENEERSAPELTDAGNGRHLATLEDRMNALEDRISAIEGRTPPPLPE